MISIAEKTLFSKQSLLRDFHRFHKVQGQNGVDNPVGGSTVSGGRVAINSDIEVTVVGGGAIRGASSQTCLAIGQCEKRCISSSLPSQRKQEKAGSPRVSKFELTGIAFLTTFHKKSFILGLVLKYRFSNQQKHCLK